jgi:hypothetical protein
MASRTSLDISQHKGYGKKLLQKAESIAFNNGYKKIAVIAGVGVRNYYRKQGYVHDTSNGCFQIKHIEPNRLHVDTLMVDITIWLLHFLIYVFYFLV